MKVKSILDQFKNASVLVIGDLILDQYLIGSTTRLSPEAPVPIVDVNQDYWVPGGSLNVANNLRELGATVYPCGIVGRDDAADRLISIVEKMEMDSTGIIKDGPNRPTTVKTRVISAGHHIVRIDKENKAPITLHERVKLVGYIHHVAECCKLDAIIIEDYGKGVIDSTIISKIMKVANEFDIPVLIDPKTHHYSSFKGAHIITPNKKEAYEASKAKKEDSVESVAMSLLEITKAKNVLITLSEDGMLLANNKGTITYIDTVAQEVADVSGAGDTVISLIALCLAIGIDTEQACRIANVGAGIVVGKSGTAIVERKELSSALRKLKTI